LANGRNDLGELYKLLRERKGETGNKAIGGREKLKDEKEMLFFES
jgi:hypothetical protein